MLLASIDVGSNTLRLLVGSIDGSRIIRQRAEMVITRLANRINKTSMLDQENIDKSVSVLKGFSRIISEYDVKYVKAVGTSALREAKNSREFINRVLSETGINIEIVSGIKEAELTAKGVLFGMARNDSSFIVDIGGGSTEWILCKNSFVLETGTIPKGVVKLMEGHIKSDPPSEKDLFSLNSEIDQLLNQLKAKTGDRIKSGTELIGTAGTITTLASIDLGLQEYDHNRIHMHHMSIQRLYDIYKRLIGIPVSERMRTNGLEPERADLIIPGILFTIKIMEIFGFKDLTVSDNGLLEGVLITLSEEVRQLS